MSPFEVVYGLNPAMPVDLVHIPRKSIDFFEAKERAKTMKQLHEQVRAKIEKMNESYKAKANRFRNQAQFQPGDLVWIHLRKERFPGKRKSKLIPRAEGLFRVLERVGESAYTIELLGDYSVSSTFNMGDLAPYLEDGPLEANVLLEEENDAKAFSRSQQSTTGP